MSKRVAHARPMTGADRETVAGLRADALAEAGGARGGDLYVARAAVDIPGPADPTRPAWVGLLAGELVGYLFGRIQPLDDGRMLGLVDAIYVDAGCRAVGVGEAMMAEAVAAFAAAGCFGVDALALPGARATKNFFEESGFTARMLVMHHRLERR
ncbi:MAG: hypothetical protein NVSMB12_16530 [Acidimicrobiales bacterium]